MFRLVSIITLAVFTKTSPTAAIMTLPFRFHFRPVRLDPMPSKLSDLSDRGAVESCVVGPVGISYLVLINSFTSPSLKNRNPQLNLAPARHLKTSRS